MGAGLPAGLQPAPGSLATPSLGPHEVRARVAEARVAVLATTDPAGSPHLVPITFAVDGDKLYSAVDHKPKTTTALKRLANIRRNPRVTLLVHSYDEDWSALWWCRLRGTAEVLAEEPGAISLLRAKYLQYGERPPSGPVIAVAIDEWTGWAAT